MDIINYSESDRLYLQMMQANIERMSGNSANCKTWLITIVAAFLAIGCRVEELNGWILLAALPVLLFWYLDSFYLNLERKMRNRQRDFINIKNGGIGDYNKALFNFNPLPKSEDDKDKGFVATNDRWLSSSIAPFYCILLAIILLITFALNWAIISSFICNHICK